MYNFSDIIEFRILLFLNNKEKSKLLSINKKLNEKKYEYVFYDINYKNKNVCNLINVNDIKNIQYFNNLKKLILCNDFNNEIGEPWCDNLPNTITYLEFGNNFNKNINIYPKKLKHLIFGNKFNREINNLPKELEKLELGKYFNKRINNLPESLTHLKLGFKFNQDIRNFPKKLKVLKLGYCFNKNLNIKNLEKLKLNNKYNKLLNIELLKNLKKLTINKNHKQKILFIENNIDCKFI